MNNVNDTCNQKSFSKHLCSNNYCVVELIHGFLKLRNCLLLLYNHNWVPSLSFQVLFFIVWDKKNYFSSIKPDCTQRDKKNNRWEN